MILGGCAHQISTLYRDTTDALMCSVCRKLPGGIGHVYSRTAWNLIARIHRDHVLTARARVVAQHVLEIRHHYRHPGAVQPNSRTKRVKRVVGVRAREDHPHDLSVSDSQTSPAVLHERRVGSREPKPRPAGEVIPAITRSASTRKLRVPVESMMGCGGLSPLFAIRHQERPVRGITYCDSSRHWFSHVRARWRAIRGGSCMLAFVIAT